MLVCAEGDDGRAAADQREHGVKGRRGGGGRRKGLQNRAELSYCRYHIRVLYALDIEWPSGILANHHPSSENSSFLIFPEGW